MLRIRRKRRLTVGEMQGAWVTCPACGQRRSLQELRIDGRGTSTRYWCPQDERLLVSVMETSPWALSVQVYSPGGLEPATT